MNKLEAKFLGFSAPWWLLLQMAIPDYAQNWRIGIGGLVFVGGFGLALAWREPGGDSPSQTLADSFVRSIGLMIALPIVSWGVLLLLMLVASIFQLVGG